MKIFLFLFEIFCGYVSGSEKPTEDQISGMVVEQLGITDPDCEVILMITFGIATVPGVSIRRVVVDPMGDIREACRSAFALKKEYVVKSGRTASFSMTFNGVKVPVNENSDWMVGFYGGRMFERHISR